MSLSFIFSIINELRVAVIGGGAWVAGSEFGASRLRDECKDLEITFLLPPMDGLSPFGKDEPVTFFLNGCNVDNVLEVGIVFGAFGVETWGDLATGDAPFFFILVMSPILCNGEV